MPPIIISEGILKTWFEKYRLPAGAVKVADAAALQDQCGAILPALAARTSRVSDIMRELKNMTPSVHASHNVITRWLRTYFGVSPIYTAGDLELKWGARIREHLEETGPMAAAELSVWLRATLKVDASATTCQTWRSREWSTAGRLLSIVDIETAIGDRLRLAEYRDRFTEEAVRPLADSLAEGQPTVLIGDPFLLRQWYVKYHPDSGPIRISSAQQLEEMLGDEMRALYAGMTDSKLVTAMSGRRKPVIFDRRVATTWISKHGSTGSGSRSLVRVRVLIHFRFGFAFFLSCIPCVTCVVEYVCN